MVDSSDELTKKLLTGRQALSNNYIDLAIQAFQEAVNAGISESTSQNSLIGIAQAYLLLGLGIKGEKEDKAVVIQINKALKLLPDETSQFRTYISLLMDIGEGLQNISFFESSSVIYEKSLQYAKTQGSEVDLKTISTISWKLAFSYQNMGKIKSAAKLYRIAADLEQDPKAAVTLYYSSAYQYYKTGMKEEALNIFQTAFDKAGILKLKDLQNEIAEYQGLISFELFKTQDPNELSRPEFEYLDLAFEKFTFTNDSDWLAKIESERALISAQIEQTNVTPNTFERIDQAEPYTSKKLDSYEIPTTKTTIVEKESTEMIESSVEVFSPISSEVKEILDETTRTLNNLTILTSESIESTKEIAELHQADLALNDDKPSKEEFQSVSSYDRLFSSAELSSTEDSRSSDLQVDSSKIDASEQQTPMLGAPMLSEVSTRLQNAGWIVHTNNISNDTKSSDPDIIAEKGLVRKKKKMIFFAEDVSDAEICSFLLQSNLETGEKYVFLLSGDPKKAKVSKKVKLVTQVDQIF
jgi:tetratricopeptide (TPR) repeat protein